MCEHLYCEYCNLIDSEEFQLFSGNNDYTCTSCGNTVTSVLWSQLFERGIITNQMLDSSELVKNKEQIIEKSKENEKETSYQRKSHIMERLSQSLCREPNIPDSILDDIRKRSNQLRKEDTGYSRRFRKCKISKQDVQRLLRHLNEEKNSSIYTTKYLEKWKTIRSILLGEDYKEYFMPDNDVIRLGFLMNQFSEAWNRLKLKGMFPERKHFPNFNFMFCKIAAFAKIQIKEGEFPLPKSTKCISKLEKYFQELALELNYDVSQI